MPPSAGLQSMTVADNYALSQRKKARNAEVVDTVLRLDSAVDQSVQKELADWLRDRYSEMGVGELLGLFSKCYLGAPYVDHQIVLTGDIIQHFKPEDVVPVAFAANRRLVQSAAYLYIEVYADGQSIPIRADGTPAI